MHKFDLGQVVATPGVLEAFERNAQEPYRFITRHAQGDWGDVDVHDWNANNHALIFGERLLSAYKLLDGTVFWVITEADRSATVVLLPDEY